jgi:TP901 family phage tail tape measure protein
MAVGILGEVAVLFGLQSTVSDDINAEWRKIDSFSSRVSTIGQGLTVGVTAPIMAGVGAIGLMTNKAAGFEKQMAEVYTLLPGISKEAMGQMQGDVLELSQEMGILPEEIVPALYSAISSGIPPENVFDFLRTASQNAIGGATDLNTAVYGLSSIVNAYGADVMDVGKASDLMFTAMRRGQTTIPELSQSLYHVNPIAAALGVSFEEVSAAMAAITLGGVPTAVAGTQLGQVFSELAKESGEAGKMFKELTGKSFKDFIAAGGTVDEALMLMKKSAEEAGTGIESYFGSIEAGKAAMALTGSMHEQFIDILDDTANATGATKTAYEQMQETASRSMDEIKAAFAATTIEIGGAFLPTLKDVMVPLLKDTIVPLIQNVVTPTVKSIGTAFGELPGPVQLGIIGLLGFAAAIGPVLMMVGPMATGLKSLAAIQKIFAASSWAAVAPYLAIIAPIAAVIGILYLLEKRYGVVSEAMDFLLLVGGNLYNWLKIKVPEAIDTASRWINGLSDTTLALTGPIGAVIIAWRHLDEIVDMAKYVYYAVSTYFYNMINTAIDSVDRVLSLLDRIGGVLGFSVDYRVRADVTQAKAQVSSFLKYLTTESKKEGVAIPVAAASAAEAWSEAGLTAQWAAEAEQAYAAALGQSTAATAANTAARRQTLEEMKLEQDLIKSGSYNPDYTGTVYAGRTSQPQTITVTQNITTGDINNSGDLKRVSYDFSKQVITAIGAKTSATVR